MLGYIRQEEDYGKRPQLSMEEIVGVRFWTLRCGEINGWWQDRRFDRLLRYMTQHGVRRIIVPSHLARNCRAVGMKPISDAILRQALMESLLDCFCRQNGLDIYCSTVRLYAQQANQTVWRAADLLATKARYVSLTVGMGQNEISRWLRWEYGLSAGEGKRHAIMQICCDDAKGENIPTLWLGHDCEKHQCVTYRINESLHSRVENNPALLSVLFEEGKLPIEAIDIKSVESYA